MQFKKCAIWILIGSMSLSMLACTKPYVESPTQPPVIEPCYIPPVPELATNRDLLQYTIALIGELRKCSEKVLLLSASSPH